MKITALVLFTLVSHSAFAEIPSTWKTHETIDTPESTYFEPESGILYVSNVGGGMPLLKDGKGWISKITLPKGKEKFQIKRWISGFNAPKGLRSANGLLYFTDIDQIVTVDLKTGKVKSKTPVQGAKFLNDTAIGTDGTLYVSDMLTSKIHALKDGKVTTFMEGKELANPNGLYVHDGKLYVAAWGEYTNPEKMEAKPGHLYSIDLKSKQITNITKEPLGQLDGLERTASGEWVVSDWKANKIYKITEGGQAQAINLEPGKNAADIGLDPATNRLFVPYMGENTVAAYTLPSK
jgi:outer membrane protein assembly factor BamB